MDLPLALRRAEGAVGQPASRVDGAVDQSLQRDESPRVIVPALVRAEAHQAAEEIDEAPLERPAEESALRRDPHPRTQQQGDLLPPTECHQILELRTQTEGKDKAKARTEKGR